MKRYTALLVGVLLVASVGWFASSQPIGVKAAGVSSFAPMVDQWNSTTPFNNPRVSHQRVLFGNHVYVMGGYYFDFNVGLSRASRQPVVRSKVLYTLF